jgi:hypothetical protein
MSEKYAGLEQIKWLLEVCGRRFRQRASTGQRIEIAPPCLRPKAIDRFMALPNLENFRYIPVMSFDQGKSICHTRTKIKGGPNARSDAFQSHWIGLGDAASFVLIRDVDDPLARRFA